jgi:hypothetical protein
MLRAKAGRCLAKCIGVAGASVYAVASVNTVRLALAVSTQGEARSHECERCTQECVRHDRCDMITCILLRRGSPASMEVAICAPGPLPSLWPPA